MRFFCARIIFCSFVALAAVLAAHPTAHAAESLGVGSYLRDTTLWGLDGQTRTFRHYQGKPLIINVWASWCGPCRAEMHSLELLGQRFNGIDFNLLGVSTDDDAAAAIAMVKQTQITFENFLDHKLTIEKMLGADRIPLTVIVDAKGRIVQKVRGSRDWNSEELLKVLETTLGIQLTKPSH